MIRRHADLRGHLCGAQQQAAAAVAPEERLGPPPDLVRRSNRRGKVLLQRWDEVGRMDDAVHEPPLPDRRRRREGALGGALGALALLRARGVQVHGAPRHGLLDLVEAAGEPQSPLDRGRLLGDGVELLSVRDGRQEDHPHLRVLHKGDVGVGEGLVVQVSQAHGGPGLPVPQGGGGHDHVDDHAEVRRVDPVLPVGDYGQQAVPGHQEAAEDVVHARRLQRLDGNAADRRWQRQRLVALHLQVDVLRAPADHAVHHAVRPPQEVPQVIVRPGLQGPLDASRQDGDDLRVHVLEQPDKIGVGVPAPGDAHQPEGAPLQEREDVVARQHVPERVRGVLLRKEEGRDLGDDGREGSGGAAQAVLRAIARVHRLATVGVDQNVPLVLIPLWIGVRLLRALVVQPAPYAPLATLRLPNLLRPHGPGAR
mmetsp:Transcript_97172/g.258234  ORF Transcript_97172/g.258234 Transcript_97172/m.258234 type:complete len:424 (-) Transcript_97172:24-1295(-)